MKCTDKLFIINTTILDIKRRFVNFDFMPTLTQRKPLELGQGPDSQNILRIKIL